MTTSAPRSIDVTTLLASLADARVVGAPHGTIEAIEYDSRRAGPGALFVALRGQATDGHRFVGAALAAGACAAVVERDFDASLVPPQSPLVFVSDTRSALSELAASFYGRPSQALRVAGVTGTNGKTTTTYLIAAILNAAGVLCGRIGTLGAHFGGAMWPLENTTPLAVEMQAALATMRERGAAAVAMEVSSHALALERVADVAFELGVLTNVTRDHLDFHGDFASYAAAKRSLFERAQHAVLNLDDPLGRQWAGELAAARGADAVTTYGLGDDAQLVARELTIAPGGSRFAVEGQAFELRLAGRFNISNALAALAVARRLGIADALSASALASVANVPGRMEHLGDGQLDVLVDYAHTPDALANVLRAARETSRGRVIVVFGCGGDRDRGKRPEMGRIAAEAADEVILTSDNPRGEDPEAIVAEIARGIPAGRDAPVELDRARAIERAIRDAAPGDTIVVAGKGHETYQIVGARTLHFDDRDAVRAALAARARGNAP
jgi:UDP-N-acetylmuramoyl-L-alanyl-D-glutamate--2,6-diaminopimelate ligase